ncbi:hypothetical protein FDX05_04760 [Citrobacter sp. wls715]|nr:hypothetical protein FDX05_04760 [Citrobacter sp. wls715]
MDSHDLNRIATGRNCQYWRAFLPFMHLHENHYTKRAGVAGIRARARYFDTIQATIWWLTFFGEYKCH